MKFARFIFWFGGLLGTVACVIYYFRAGSSTYYGLIGNSLSLQLLFFLIGWNPQQFRLMMIPAAIGKFIWVPTLIGLYFKGQVGGAELAYSGIPHAVLGILFLIAYFRLPKAVPHVAHV